MENNQEKPKSLKLNMLLNSIKVVMGVVFPLISFPYVSRILEVENIGKYNFASSVVNYFVLLGQLGIAGYAIREGALLKINKGRFEKFADEIFSLNIISTIAAYLLLFIVLLIVPLFADYRLLIAILSLQILFKTMSLEWIYTIFEDFLYITIRSIAFQILSLAMLFLFVKNKNDLYNYAMITVISGTGSSILNYYHAKKYCKLRFTKRINFKSHIKPIMTLFAMSATITIYVSSDVTILGFICGDYYVGIYSVAVKIYNIIKNVLASLFTVSIPRLSALCEDKYNKQFTTIAEDIYLTMLTLLIPAVVGIIILRNNIISIVSGNAYEEAGGALGLLGIALICCMGATFWGQCILVPHKKEGVVLKATIVSALLNVGLNIILIPKWHANAAAFTTILAEGLVYVWCAIDGNKIIKINILQEIIKIFVGTIGVITVIKILGLIQLSMIVQTLISVMLSIIVYFCIEIALKNNSVIRTISGIKTKMNDLMK